MAAEVDDENVDYPDMVNMPVLSKELMNTNVSNRFKKDAIYTLVSDVLIAVNPFRRLESVMGDEAFDIYHYTQPAETIRRSPPHIFMIARRAFNGAIGLGGTASNQSILISGESGAGKTESTKLCIRYLATMSNIIKTRLQGMQDNAGDEDEEGDLVEERLVSANPVLEAFGNAKTLRNDNSSRFGKWLSLQLSTEGVIVGGFINQYLLEESRVVEQLPQERNFNIFYQVCAGASDAGSPEDFRFLNHSGCTTIDGLDDNDEYNILCEAMRSLGVDIPTRQAIFRIIKAVLHLGNVTFTDASKATVDEKTCAVSLDKAGDMMFGEAKSTLAFMMTQQERKMGRDTTLSPRTKAQAEALRDSICKAMYGNLFVYMVQVLNKSLRAPDPSAGAKERVTIGILDIFGFEVFAVNGFEQLCINYANEKLQKHFLSVLIVQEKKMYEEQGLNVANMEFADNTPCVQLLESKPSGVFPMLADHLKVPKATDMTYLTKLHDEHKGHEYYKKPRKGGVPEFTIVHYAETVTYTVNGFLAKNTARLGDDITAALTTNGVPLIKSIFDEKLREPEKKAEVTEEKESQPKKGKISGKKSSSKRGGKSKSKKKGPTSQGAAFKSSLDALLKTIKATKSSFIRCIKPNTNKAPREYEPVDSLRQLVTSGVMDAVTIRQLGYAERMPHQDFLDEFEPIIASYFSDPPVRGAALVAPSGPLAPRMDTVFNRIKDDRSVVQAQQKSTVALWQVGRDLVFYKAEVSVVLEQLKTELQGRAACHIQKLGRGWLVRQAVKEIRQALIQLGVLVKTRQWEELDTHLEFCRELDLPEHLLAAARRAREKDLALKQAAHNIPRVFSVSADDDFSQMENKVRSIMKKGFLCGTKYELPGIADVKSLTECPTPSDEDQHGLIPLLYNAEQVLTFIRTFMGTISTHLPNLLPSVEAEQALRAALADHSTNIETKCGALVTVEFALGRPEAKSLQSELDNCQNLIDALTTATTEKDLDKLTAALSAASSAKLQRDAVQTALLCLKAQKLQKATADCLDADPPVLDKCKKLLTALNKEAEKKDVEDLTVHFARFAGGVADCVAQLTALISTLEIALAVAALTAAIEAKDSTALVKAIARGDELKLEDPVLQTAKTCAHALDLTEQLATAEKKEDKEACTTLLTTLQGLDPTVYAAFLDVPAVIRDMERVLAKVELDATMESRVLAQLATALTVAGSAGVDTKLVEAGQKVKQAIELAAEVTAAVEAAKLDECKALHARLTEGVLSQLLNEYMKEIPSVETAASRILAVINRLEFAIAQDAAGQELTDAIQSRDLARLNAAIQGAVSVELETRSAEMCVRAIGLEGEVKTALQANTVQAAHVCILLLEGQNDKPELDAHLSGGISGLIAQLTTKRDGLLDAARGVLQAAIAARNTAELQAAIAAAKPLQIDNVFEAKTEIRPAKMCILAIKLEADTKTALGTNNASSCQEMIVKLQDHKAEQSELDVHLAAGVAGLLSQLNALRERVLAAEGEAERKRREAAEKKRLEELRIEKAKQDALEAQQRAEEERQQAAARAEMAAASEAKRQAEEAEAARIAAEKARIASLHASDRAAAEKAEADRQAAETAKLQAKERKEREAAAAAAAEAEAEAAAAEEAARAAAEATPAPPDFDEDFPMDFPDDFDADLPPDFDGELPDDPDADAFDDFEFDFALPEPPGDEDLPPPPPDMLPMLPGDDDFFDDFDAPDDLDLMGAEFDDMAEPELPEDAIRLTDLVVGTKTAAALIAAEPSLDFEFPDDIDFSAPVVTTPSSRKTHRRGHSVAAPPSFCSGDGFIHGPPVPSDDFAAAEENFDNVDIKVTQDAKEKSPNQSPVPDAKAQGQGGKRGVEFWPEMKAVNSSQRPLKKYDVAERGRGRRMSVLGARHEKKKEQKGMGNKIGRLFSKAFGSKKSNARGGASFSSKSLMQATLDTGTIPDPGIFTIQINGAAELVRAGGVFCIISYYASQDEDADPVAMFETKKANSSDPVWNNTFQFEVNDLAAASLFFDVRYTQTETEKVTEAFITQMGDLDVPLLEIAQLSVQRMGNKNRGRKVCRLVALENTEHGQLDVEFTYSEYA